MEAATSGSLSPLDAARLSLRRAGQDSAVLDGLLAPAPAAASTAEVADGCSPLWASAAATSRRTRAERRTHGIADDGGRTRALATGQSSYLGTSRHPSSDASRADGLKMTTSSIRCAVRQCGPPGRRGELRQARDPQERRGKGPRQGCRDRHGSGTRSAAEGLALTGKGATLGSGRAWRCDEPRGTIPRHARRGAAGGQQCGDLLCLLLRRIRTIARGGQRMARAPALTPARGR